MLPTKTLVGLSDFSSSCDEFISGKFIFAINKVSKILKSISDCNEVYSLFAECLKDFNYSKEFAHAKQKLPTKKGEFIVPQDRKTLLALTFCMLVDIQEGNIDLRALVDDYFYDGEHDEFVNFANKIIKPFKEAVLYCFEEEPEKEEPKEPSQEQHQQPQINEDETTNQDQFAEVFDEIDGICDIIIDNLLIMNHKNQELKEDCLFMANKIKESCQKHDIKQVCILTVAMKYILQNFRKLRFLIKQLTECTYKFYE